MKRPLRWGLRCAAVGFAVALVLDALAYSMNAAHVHYDLDMVYQILWPVYSGLMATENATAVSQVIDVLILSLINAAIYFTISPWTTFFDACPVPITVASTSSAAKLNGFEGDARSCIPEMILAYSLLIVDEAITLKCPAQGHDECNGEWVLKKSRRLAGGDSAEAC